jgi:hypothetical protein
MTPEEIARGPAEHPCPDCGLCSCVCEPADAIWCDRCQGTGSIDCYCAGDFCCCERGGEITCPRCHGDGEFAPKPGQLEREAKARAELAAVMTRALGGGANG